MRELSNIDCRSISGGNTQGLALSVLAGMIFGELSFAIGGAYLQPLSATQVLTMGSLGAHVGITIGLIGYLYYISNDHTD